jgi:hypothetical protein
VRWYHACWGHEMKLWFKLLLPMLVWLLHFLGIYTAAEFAPQSLSVLTPVLTIIALTALAFAAISKSFQLHWQSIVFYGGTMLAVVAIIWQTLPQYL